MEPLLQLHGVGKHYGSHTALEGIDLTVTPGQSLALLGHNGAGKTTLVKIMLGLTRPSQGRLTVGLAGCRDVHARAWRHRLGFRNSSRSRCRECRSQLFDYRGFQTGPAGAYQRRLH